MQLLMNCIQYCSTDSQGYVRLCPAERRIIKIRAQAFSDPGIIVPVKSVETN